MAKVRYVIGIDPGANTGIAVWDREQEEVIQTTTTTFWPAYDYICALYKTSETKIIIEVPLRTVMYARQASKGYKGAGQNRLMADAAGNAKESTLLAQGLELAGYEVKRVRPIKAKWTAIQLKRVTGIEGRTNQHVRDAIALCFKA